MSINVGGIYVRTGGEHGADDVLAVIRSHWRQRGATVEERVDPRAFEPLGMEQTHRLCLAVSEEENGWRAVLDSERYTADYGLAARLAHDLRAAVVWFQIAGVVDLARLLGVGDSDADCEDEAAVVDWLARERVPHALAYFDELAADARRADFTFVAFRDVAPPRYDDGDRFVAGGDAEERERDEDNG